MSYFISWSKSLVFIVPKIHPDVSHENLRFINSNSFVNGRPYHNYTHLVNTRSRHFSITSRTPVSLYVDNRTLMHHKGEGKKYHTWRNGWAENYISTKEKVCLTWSDGLACDSDLDMNDEVGIWFSGGLTQEHHRKKWVSRVRENGKFWLTRAIQRGRNWANRGVRQWSLDFKTSNQRKSEMYISRGLSLTWLCSRGKSGHQMKTYIFAVRSYTI